MLPYVFHPLAAKELEAAAAYYESRAPGKGLEFAQQIKAAVEQIRAFPESAPVTRGSVRSVVIQPSSRWRLPCTTAPNPIAFVFLQPSARGSRRSSSSRSWPTPWRPRCSSHRQRRARRSAAR
ncbi:MAG: hypothetical protein GEV06_17760 [Luteitalea sp.]|nr:hypothetical protein [Luteitalea sp.]